MARAKRIRWWVLLVVFLYGVVTGPAYLCYCEFLSGAGVGEFLLFDKDAEHSELGVGGVAREATRPVNQDWDTQVSIYLSPEMNPIGFNVVADKVQMSGLVQYSAELTLGDTRMWGKTFTFSGDRDSQGRHAHEHLRLKIFRVSETGDYQFNFRADRDNYDVRKLRLKVRRNVTVASKGIYVPGIVILVGWILFILFSGQKKQAESSPQATTDSSNG